MVGVDAGGAVASGSESSHLSCQKKIACLLPSSHCVSCESIVMCLLMRAPKYDGEDV